MKKFISVLIVTILILSFMVTVPTFAEGATYIKDSVIKITLKMPNVVGAITGIEGILNFDEGLDYVEDSFTTPHISDMFFNPSESSITFNSSALENYDLGEDKVVFSVNFALTKDFTELPVTAEITDAYRVEGTLFIDIDTNSLFTVEVISVPEQPTNPTDETSSTVTTEPSSDAQATKPSSETQPTEISSETQPTEASFETQTTEPSSETKPTEVSSETQSTETSSETNATEPTETQTTETTQPATKAPSLTATKKSIAAAGTFTLGVKNKGTSKVTYTSSDKKVIKVTSKGVVTGLMSGKATITVKVGTKKLTCKVTVTNNPIIKKGSKALSSAVYKVKKGKTLTFNIYRKVASINNVYSSSKKTIARVTSKNNVTKFTIKGYKVGSATVSVKINGVKTYKIKIKVVK